MLHLAGFYPLPAQQPEAAPWLSGPLFGVFDAHSGVLWHPQFVGRGLSFQDLLIQQALQAPQPPIAVPAQNQFAANTLAPLHAANAQTDASRDFARTSQRHDLDTTGQFGLGHAPGAAIVMIIYVIILIKFIIVYISDSH